MTSPKLDFIETEVYLVGDHYCYRDERKQAYTLSMAEDNRKLFGYLDGNRTFYENRHMVYRQNQKIDETWKVRLKKESEADDE